MRRIHWSLQDKPGADSRFSKEMRAFIGRLYMLKISNDMIADLFMNRFPDYFKDFGPDLEHKRTHLTEKIERYGSEYSNSWIPWERMARGR